MKFAIACIASILTSTVHGLVPALNVRENVNLEARAGAAQACGDPRHAVPLLRAYSPGQIDHFYTANAAELQNAVTHLGYNDEGTAGYIFADQQPHTVPLYRLYNGAIGDHFYTTNAAERDNAAKNLGYKNEGITGYVYPDTGCGLLPLYRLYSSSGTDHFYTMSAAERDNASNKLGYAQEGVAGYIFPFFNIPALADTRFFLFFVFAYIGLKFDG